MATVKLISELEIRFGIISILIHTLADGKDYPLLICYILTYLLKFRTRKALNNLDRNNKVTLA